MLGASLATTMRTKGTNGPWRLLLLLSLCTATFPACFCLDHSEFLQSPYRQCPLWAFRTPYSLSLEYSICLYMRTNFHANVISGLKKKLRPCLPTQVWESSPASQTHLGSFLLACELSVPLAPDRQEPCLSPRAATCSITVELGPERRLCDFAHTCSCGGPELESQYPHLTLWPWWEPGHTCIYAHTDRYYR